MKESVYVTGLGLVSHLGSDRNTNWRNITHSRGQAPAVNRGGFSRAKELVEGASTEAVQDACLTSADPERVGCTVSASKPLFDGDTLVPPDAINDFVSRRFGFAGEKRNVIAA